MSKLLKQMNETGQTLDQLSESGLEYAKKKGIDALKITNSNTIQKKLVVENKEFTLANSFDSQKFSIVSHNDQKSGSASVNTASESVLFDAIDNATTMASFSVADENLIFSKSEEAGQVTKLEFLLDSNLAEMEFSEMQDGMKEILAVLTEDSRIALERLEMDLDVSRQSLYNSYGVKHTEMQTTIGWSWMGMAKDGDVVTGFDYDYNFSFSKDDYLEKALREAKMFPQRLTDFLNPSKAPTYKGPILLSPRAVGEILTDGMLFHLSGRSVMDGKSKWSDKLDKQVVSERISLSDLPHEKEFMGATSYDDDGMATNNIMLIENGVLKNHFINCYTGKALSRTSTCTAGGPFGLSIASGTDRLEDMKGARSELLVVDRFAGNSDPISGDFSGVAKSSRIFKDGNDAGSVTETMIAGNLFEVLMNITGVSSVVSNVSGTYQSPWILIDGVSVTGN